MYFPSVRQFVAIRGYELVYVSYGTFPLLGVWFHAVYNAGSDSLLGAVVPPNYVPVLNFLACDNRVYRLVQGPSPPSTSL